MDTTRELLQSTSFPNPLQDRNVAPHVRRALDNLSLAYTLNGEEYELWGAGFPNYRDGLFARDLYVYSELAENPRPLRDTLKFGSQLIGKKQDPATGEQPGAHFHEYNVLLHGGVQLEGRPGNTLYNASDASALFLRAHEQYLQMTGDTSLFKAQRTAIDGAVGYIKRHIDAQGLFVVDPKHAGAEQYTLKVTSWKDSEVKGRENGEPLYPVIYPLVHIQNMAGLRSAARLLNSPEMQRDADRMRDALPHLFDKEIEGLSIAIDRGGRISGISSDILHALNYLTPGDIDASLLERFLANVSFLETTLGYKTLSSEDSEEVEDQYHGETVWTHEQAIIHKGARKHRMWAEEHGLTALAGALRGVERISEQVYTNYLIHHPDENPELFKILPDGSYEVGENKNQLWAIGAREYFERVFEEEERQAVA